MHIKFTILINLFLMILVGCSSFGTPKHVKNWPSIKIDMTKYEIEETLGKPNSIKSAIKYEDDASLFGKFFINAMFDGWYEKWYYGKDPSILSSIIPFYPFGPPSKTYIVYFDKDGRVAGYLEPSDNDNYKTRTRVSTGAQKLRAR